jgi:hypothetical protein
LAEKQEANKHWIAKKGKRIEQQEIDLKNKKEDNDDANK